MNTFRIVNGKEQNIFFKNLKKDCLKLYILVVSFLIKFTSFSAILVQHCLKLIRNGDVSSVDFTSFKMILPS